MTGDLIGRLSEDLSPRRGNLVARRLGLALAFGGAAALVGVAATLGLNRHMATAATHAIFWIKLAYAGAVAAIGAWSVERIARPGGSAGRRLPLLAAPILALAGLASVRLLAASPEDRVRLVLGHSASVCPWYILLTSVPILIGLVWALRGLAPTRLRTAGAVAGVTAGGLGACVYCLHCPENAAPFVAIWYSLGMAASGLLGAFLGPRVLRW